MTRVLKSESFGGRPVTAIVGLAAARGPSAGRAFARWRSDRSSLMARLFYALQWL